MSADPETLAKGLDWVNRELAARPEAGKWKVVDEAAIRFNLGPLDAEWLLNQLTQAKRTE